MNQHPDFLLNEVNEPEDIKTMSLDELKQLATEMRQLILERDEKIGGHVGPNLGIVETTLALHYVFNSPHDKIVWDVSHQCYAHKMLTGRKQGFLDPDHYDEVSGFTAPEESDHDFFKVGHTSQRRLLSLTVWPLLVTSLAKRITSLPWLGTVRSLAGWPLKD